jgi:hypothetical protein
MGQSPTSSGTISNTKVISTGPRRQVLRAWVLLILGFAIFAALFALAATTAYSFVRDATQTQTAIVQAVSGSSLLIRSSNQQDWRLVSERAVVQEGDQIATGSATVGWITLFDQGTIEVSENSLVQINRMRTSRLFQEQKEIEIEPIRGSIYIGMAPRGEFNSSVIRVRSGPATVRMRDEIRSTGTGSFIVETQRIDPTGDENNPILSVRVAVLRGIASVETEHGSQMLSVNEQVLIEPSGMIGAITQAKRELVRNGDFDRHLSDWVEFHDYPGEVVSEQAVIERVPVDRDGEPGVALQISRSSANGNNWEAGVQQTIGQSLRVHSSLHLRMDIRLDEQQPLGGGIELTEYPLIVKLNYVDVQGQQREWWHGFYVIDDVEEAVPQDRATLVRRGQWEEIDLDLRNLSPLPRQISSIELYSSGHSYRTLVTNVSLTSSETSEDEYD